MFASAAGLFGWMPATTTRPCSSRVRSTPMLPYLTRQLAHSEDPDILGKPNYIARIDPATGKLLGWVDLDGISPDDVKRGQENTLNGIAYDAATDRIFVTGKNWRKLFEIKITPPKTQ